MNNEILITISAIQHFIFCPRQFALIHIERFWEDNWLTAHGSTIHKNVDRPGSQRIQGTKIERSVHITSSIYGIIGIIDAVAEDSATGEIIPIEYKRGTNKISNCDRAQLCAQVLCLEEMKEIRIQRAALWYWKERRKEFIEISQPLRDETIRAIRGIRSLINNYSTPPPVLAKHCKACSLNRYCRPTIFSRDRSKIYTEEIFATNETT